ncbi:hypothetical protein OEZ85_004710 [Tetradesmus obliquus]|uniref:TNFR-Cys domain-containing protein n=1 Tax=Tetradesmus obliquus TaxID=3088 RepID=A0ABY8ULK4_TETOB|nr:hypothetical protein OEZ85_004710 [Tetradesmus obliquus]
MYVCWRYTEPSRALLSLPVLLLTCTCWKLEKATSVMVSAAHAGNAAHTIFLYVLAAAAAVTAAAGTEAIPAPQSQHQLDSLAASMLQHSSKPAMQSDNGRPPPPYPAGECVRCSAKQLKPSCPYGTCTATSRCNALFYAALSRPSCCLSTQSRCMPHAHAKCSAPGMWACSGCHNWVVLTAECGAAGRPVGGQQCERHGNYSVMRQAPSARKGIGHLTSAGARLLSGPDSSYSVMRQAPSARDADPLLGPDGNYSVMRQAPSARNAIGHLTSAGASLLSGPDGKHGLVKQAPSARNADPMLGSDGNYSVMRQAPSVGRGRRCVAEDRWLLLPNIACTAVVISPLARHRGP